MSKSLHEIELELKELKTRFKERMSAHKEELTIYEKRINDMWNIVIAIVVAAITVIKMVK